MELIFSLAIALIAGLLMTRVLKPFGLPAVTAYIIAGVLVGPYCLGALGINGLGFTSQESVAQLDIVCSVALGFIAFAIGNEFRMSSLKTIGKQAVVVGIFEAAMATAIVDAALITLHFMFPDIISLPVAITLGAIAAATAPAATLMIVRQYKAKGNLTKLLLTVVALDDAIGLIIFAVSFGIARGMNGGEVSVMTVAVKPILEIVFSLGLGALMGWLLNFVERFFNSNSKRLAITITFVLLTVAISMIKFPLFGMEMEFSPLLTCMMMGMVFCNLCKFSKELMEKADKWTVPLFILFFVISGAGLELNVFMNVGIVIIGIIYIVMRALGKCLGANIGTSIMHCEDKVKKNLGLTLIPQAGVALGMSLMAFELGEEGHTIRNIVLFGVLVYELIGPSVTKFALTRAGEIVPMPHEVKHRRKLFKHEEE